MPKKGRPRTLLNRVENLSAREALYLKRKAGFLKKAKELSILCDSDCGLIMFSPDGELTTFASDGRVEDTLLRFLKRSNENKGGPSDDEKNLSSRLEKARNEVRMIDMVTKLQGLDDTINKLDGRIKEAQKKMRHYKPDIEKMTTLSEVEVHQKFLEKALESIEEAKEKLFLESLEQQTDDMIEDDITASAVVDEDQSTSDSDDSDN